MSSSGHCLGPECRFFRFWILYMRSMPKISEICQLYRGHAPTRQGNLLKAINKIRVVGENPRKMPYLVDADAGANWTHIARDCMPTLTASRGSANGFWITSRNCFTNLRETTRCQGYNSRVKCPNDVPASKFGRMLGNVISVNVLTDIVR